MKGIRIMSQAIYKYVLKQVLFQTVSMPKHAKILTVQMQREDICIWALVDKEEERTEERRIKIVGTGHEIHTDIGTYIGTIQMDNGSLVWHVFDLGKAI
jgi:ACT domain-containing protein